MTDTTQIQTEINACVKTLRENGFIIFPGETGWCIACSAANAENITKMKTAEVFSDFTVLLDATGKLNKYITDIPDALWDLVEFSTRPLTFLLATAVNLPGVLLNERNEIAFRIVKDDFTHRMLQRFSGSVLSASLPDHLKPAKGGNVTILNTPAYMVNLRTGTTKDQGVILRLSTGGRIEFIRK